MAIRGALASALLVLLAGAGCGYRSGNLMRDDIRRVSVPIFANDTFYRHFEIGLTQAVVTRIEKETHYRVADASDADVILEGRIAAYGLSVLQEDARNVPTETQVVLTVGIRLVDARTGAVLFRDTVRDGHSFVPAAGETELAARDLLFRRIAQYIVERAFERDW